MFISIMFPKFPFHFVFGTSSEALSLVHSLSLTTTYIKVDSLGQQNTNWDSQVAPLKLSFTNISVLSHKEWEF